MAYRIGPTLAVGGEQEYMAAMKRVRENMKYVAAEAAAATSAFSKNDKSVESLTTKNKGLERALDVQRKAVKAAEESLQRMKNDGIDPSSVAYQRMEANLNNAKATLNKTENEINDNTAAIKKMNDEAKSDKLESFAGGLKKVGAAAGKTLVVGLKAAATAMAAIGVAAGAAAIKLGKEVIQQFGELEQNLGGSEAVFGKYARSIQKTGENAYKNLGVSQSAYLATANKMGALFQGSGIEQQKSLGLTEKAMQRAADMASVMGIDMQMALDSVAGAAKGNFTMMDNLGVAMNATNVEAYALAKGLDFTWKTATQAEKAEVAMQMFFENTEQYAGNFARESTQTITGSIGMMKAAVGSFTAGMGNADADMKNLTKNLVDAFGAVVKNIVPVLENIVIALPPAFTAIFAAMGDLVPMLASTFAAMLPELINVASSALTEMVGALVGVLPSLLPMLLDGAQQLLTGFIDAITSNVQPLAAMISKMAVNLVGFITRSLPVLITGAMQIVTAIAQGIAKSLPELIPAIVAGLMTCVQAIIDNLPLLLDAGLQIIIGLVQGIIDAIPVLIAALPEVITSVISYLLGAIPMIIEAGIQLLTSLVTALPDIIAAVVAAIPLIIDGVITAVIDAIPLIIQAGIDLLISLVQNLPKIITEIVKAIPKIISGIVDALIGNIDKIIMAGVQLFIALIENLPTIIIEIVKAIPKIIEGIVNAFGSLAYKIVEIGGNLLKGIWEGISNAAGWLWGKIKGFFNGIVDGIKNFFGIRSPSTLFAGFGKNMALGLGEGFGAEMKGVAKKMVGAVPTNFDIAGHYDFGGSGYPAIGNTGGIRQISYTINSPKALGLREIRQEMILTEQRQRLMGV